MMATGGDGVRGRKRHSPHGRGGMTQFCRDSSVQLCTRKKLLCFYMTFLCRASTSPPTSVHPLQLPSSNDHIAAHFMLLIDTDSTTTDPPAIPVEQLLEYQYEDGRCETCMELEA